MSTLRLCKVSIYGGDGGAHKVIKCSCLGEEEREKQNPMN